MEKIEVGIILLSTAWFGPVYYYHAVKQADSVLIEKDEHFQKQTWRNRCLILAANGPLSLVVPIEHGRSPGRKISDIRIAYHVPWQRNHWRSIHSAYKNSPYFDFYVDDILPFFTRKYAFLLDYNLEIHNTIMRLLDMRKETQFTTAFEQVEEPFTNLRECISPKKQIAEFDPLYRFIPYTQVFEDKFPFVPGLSILDLLFCAGPESHIYL